ncbi:MAG: metal-dependent transcriptional regulator [Planctomycetota bacterium]|jgi:DtxR family Mn-dependent transcriptional regulator
MAKDRELQLSASLEDYIEAIFNLAGESNVARSKDIAERLSVSKSSVTGALRLLKEKGLVNYEPYGFVTLTQPGRTAAAEIVQKHNILKSFFVNVLGVETDLAQEAACRAEHALGSEIIERLLAFSEFAAQTAKNGYDLTEEFQRFCEGAGPEGGETVATDSGKEGRNLRALSTVGVGQRARVAKIEAGRDLNSRLAAMGLVPNAEVTVMSNAHPGPFVVNVKGSKIMLGRGMANKIMVS